MDPPGDLDMQNEADKKLRQAVLGNFSSPGIEFFGTRTVGNSVAYVVDISSSMAEITTSTGLSNFELVKRELLRSVDSLESSQTFTVVCFNERAHLLQDLVSVNATKESKAKLKSWFDRLSADGGTDPLAGMQMILRDTPDVIFLLSDGEFDGSCINAIQAMNRKKSVINTVSIGMNAATLQQIADDAGGQFRVVK